jgi:hypothetical protein
LSLNIEFNELRIWDINLDLGDSSEFIFLSSCFFFQLHPSTFI